MIGAAAWRRVQGGDAKTLRPLFWCALVVCLTSLSVRAGNAAGGATVVRFQDQVGFFVADEAHGLMSFHGTNLTFVELCSGAPPTFDTMSIQLIDAPSGALHALFSTQSHNMIIYRSPLSSSP